MKYATEIVIVLSLIVASTWIVLAVNLANDKVTETGTPGDYMGVPGIFSRDEAKQLADEIERTAFHVQLARDYTEIDQVEDLVTDDDAKGLAAELLSSARVRDCGWSCEDLVRSVRNLARYDDLSQLSAEELAGLNEIDRTVLDIGQRTAEVSVIFWKRNGLIEQRAGQSQQGREDRRHVP